MDKNKSLAKGLFLGSIVTENLLPYPKLGKDESDLLEMLIESIDKFMEGKSEEFREYDEAATQPKDYINSLKELGLFGLIVPEEMGGIGLGARGYSRTLQQVGRYDASTALTIGAHSSIGMRGLLLFGTEKQKEQYCERLATGEMVAAFCLTESGAGSDAASIKTKATKNSDGSWELTGEKIWITNGPFADFFTVFAKTDSSGAGKMSAFIVERSWEGVSSGPKEDKMGIRASATSTINFNKVKVPAENLLGEEGKGFKIAMAILNSGRTGLGGGCVGAMKQCINLAKEHAINRKQFGKSIGDFITIQDKLAQMTVRCFATESLVNYVASLVDNGCEDYSLEAAVSKIYATEALWFVADEALQISGGNGFMKEYPYERIVRDSRINRIFEGTNEILRMYVALSGFKDAEAYFKELLEVKDSVFNDPIKGFGILSSYVSKKFTQYTSINSDEIDVSPELKFCAEIYSDYTLSLARSVESLMKKHGKKLVGKQLQSKRIADVVIDLVTGLSLTSRVDTMIKDKGAESCQSELEIAEIFAQSAKRRMNNNLRRIDKNEDKVASSLGQAILEKDYTWDVI